MSASYSVKRKKSNVYISPICYTSLTVEKQRTVARLSHNSRSFYNRTFDLGLAFEILHTSNPIVAWESVGRGKGIKPGSTTGWMSLRIIYLSTHYKISAQLSLKNIWSLIFFCFPRYKAIYQNRITIVFGIFKWNPTSYQQRKIIEFYSCYFKHFWMYFFLSVIFLASYELQHHYSATKYIHLHSLF